AGSLGKRGGGLGAGSDGYPHPALSTWLTSPERGCPMLKGFKEFLSRGNIVDLAVAVVIGTAFTALVTKFTDSIITPLTSSIGAKQQTDVGVLKIHLWSSGQEINLNTLLSAAINFILVAVS